MATTIGLRGGSGTNGAIQINGADSIVLDSSGIFNFGSGQLYVAASGNVGIGTSSPSSDAIAKFINVSDATSSGLVLTAARKFSIYSSASSTLVFRDETAGATRMVLDSSGNVGIGTSSPSTKLNLYGTSTQELRISTNTSGDVRFGADLQGAFYNWIDNYRSSGAMAFGTNNTERMRIDSSGNLGLGVTPSAWAGVVPIQSTYGALAGNAQVNITANAYYNSGWKYIGTGVATQYLQNSGIHSWYTAPSGTAGNAISFTQAMTLDSSGRLLIGLTSGTRKFSVYSSDDTPAYFGTAVANSYVQLSGSGDVYLGSVAGAFTVTTGGAEKLRVDTSGNLLVGTTSASVSTPGAVYGGVGYANRAGQAGSWGTHVSNLYWNGSAHQLWVDATNTGVITVTSDYRIKKNILTQTESALNKIIKIRPVTFEIANYKNLFKEDGVAREGFIAHELAEVIPSAVEGEKDAENQIQSLKLDALCSVMVKAIQELKAELDELKSAK